MVDWPFLLNVVRDIAPAFDTREVEASLFIFLPGFRTLQNSANSGAII